MEIEVKYKASPEQAALLWQHPLLAPWLGESRVVPMEAIYYDTPSADCAAASFVLRLRREGEKQICAAKGGTQLSADGMARRIEIEKQVESLEQGVQALLEDPDLPQSWRSILLAGPLVEKARMTFSRRAVDYRRQGLWVELCYDQGQILAGGKSAPIAECELELKEGEEDRFLQLVAALEQSLGWKPWTQSKYTRAKELMK